MLPSTRYLGSKRKIVGWIWSQIGGFSFDTFLDAFGGTGVVGYCAKRHGKRVFYNDVLKFNYQVGLSIIENGSVKLSQEDVDFLLCEHDDVDYPTFIEDTFKDIYYTDEENRWLDMIVTNIKMLCDKYKRALAFAALGQSCLIKRPFNLFHRRNLYFRFRKVKRSFRNYGTWNKPFEEHFRKFVEEYNSMVFSNFRYNEAYNFDVFDLDCVDADMVYLDPPYIPIDGEKPNYRQYYHFLEGLVDYDSWGEMIDSNSDIKAIRSYNSPWIDKSKVNGAFDRLFSMFNDAKFLVVSYRSDGVPSMKEIYAMLEAYKEHVKLRRKRFRYVLSKKETEELLFIAY
jgi:adenine-specific DNA methylase